MKDFNELDKDQLKRQLEIYDSNLFFLKKHMENNPYGKKNRERKKIAEILQKKRQQCLAVWLRRINGGEIEEAKQVFLWYYEREDE